jgi:hypothetical protein
MASSGRSDVQRGSVPLGKFIISVQDPKGVESPSSDGGRSHRREGRIGPATLRSLDRWSLLHLSENSIPVHGNAEAFGPYGVAVMKVQLKYNTN